MAAVDDLTGLIAPVVAAGVVMKVTESMFGSVNQMQSQPPRRKKSKRRTTRSSSNSFGNFSNVGF